MAAVEDSQTDNDLVIGICGGVGPLAGTNLHQKIIGMTQASGDKDHLDVIHLSISSLIGDRTGYLLDMENNENSAVGAFKVVRAISASAKALNKPCVVGVPCNTFHAPPIFDEFTRLINEYNALIYDNDATAPGFVHQIHMIQATFDYLISQNYKSVGLMSTTGTRTLNLYQNIAAAKGITIYQVAEDTQEDVHDSIYNTEYGLKALSRATDEVRAKYESWVLDLKEQGAEAVILGCTEIPIALPESELNGIPLVDPVDMLAAGLISRIDASKLIGL